MAFPLSWRGSFTVPIPEAARVTDTDVIDGIERELAAARASSITAAGDGIAYSVAWFRPTTTNWNILSPFDRGNVAVHRIPTGVQVAYEVSFRRLFWISIVLVPAFFGTSLIVLAHESLSFALPVLAFMWLWLYGANVLVALARYPGFLHRAVTRTIETAAGSQPRSTQAQSA